MGEGEREQALLTVLTTEHYALQTSRALVAVVAFGVRFAYIVRASVAPMR
ncbi:hypothetical protein ACIA47_30235 [Micromonospora sp. NPDC051227]|nr:hypothetical protein [Micromonospora sp. STR1s_5]